MPARTNYVALEIDDAIAVGRDRSNMDPIAIFDMKGRKRCSCFVEVASGWEIKSDRLAMLIGINPLDGNVSE
jgi:hypothetical protein